MKRRRIAHLDMDAFFASVELLRRPELKGLPVAIGGRGDSLTPAGRAALIASRGVVSTSTYPARAFGVRSGMALRRAFELCPSLIVLPVDFDAYRDMSRRFKAAVREVAERIEDWGIDEIYIDLSDVPGDDLELAAEIKRRVLAATGLTCSIGIAPNKLLAKIASDMDKPDGVTLIGEEDIATRIWPLPARVINGIGPKAAARLAELGIESIGELAAAPPALLMRHFGPHYAAWLLDAAHGRDERPLTMEHEPKSRSRETTFPHDTRDGLTLYSVIAKLSRQVAADLAARGLAGRSIGIKVKYDNFTIHTRDHRLSQATGDAQKIRDTAVHCLQRVPIDRKIRLLGVKVSDLEEADPLARGENLSLF
ncbi:DNA polymerase IV [Niveibacterium terrae]|uniref:DNA polymerase IV n=1 Tax=Niveibacterium terrae TaxID=3373598 RepID=UPI003A915364